MAVDSRLKRESCLAVGLDFRCVRPDPDGAIDAADRQHVSGIYRGIAAAGMGAIRTRRLLLKVG